MKVTFQTCCGVDVHKSFLVATIIKTSSGIEPSYQKRRFSTFNNSILEFKKWLLENECLYVCMESTGKYYIPVYNVLESHISNIVVANPKWVRAVKGEKDDDKDAKCIADLFKFGIVRSSFIPQKDFRILRELTRYMYKLVNIRSSEKNRFQNALTSGNCKLDMVFTDVFGKSASNIIDLILSDNTYTDEDILSKVHKKCKASPDMDLDSINGTDLTPVQKSRIELVNDHIKQLSSNIQRLDKLMLAYK